MEEPDQDSNLEEVAGVPTRAQEKRERQAIKPLTVGKSDISTVSAQVLMEAQQNDPTMEKL